MKRALALTFALAGCMTTDAEVDITYTNHVHAMPYRSSSDSSMGHGPADVPSAPAGAHLTYYGGKIIPNVKVSQVLYGSGTYISQVSGTQMGSFYTQSQGGVWDWLNEYNTSSPAQTIGRGSFIGKTQISPSSSRNGSTIDDSAIQAELVAQIQAGTLPQPDNNTIYMINFPAGKTITQGGSSSCVGGGFCAYHGTLKIGSQNVYYGVLPDMSSSSGCASGCGNSTTFNNQTSVASHELIEAVTDAEVGLSTTVGPPLAWYDQTNGEIGDICNAQQGTFVGGDGVTYTIQQEFSNQQNNCITTRSVSSTPDFGIADSPSSTTLAPGATATVNVTTSKINNSTQSITLSVSGLPSGVTGSFSPATVTAGGSSTLTLTASSTASGSGTATITGTSGSTSHSATESVTVSGGGGGGGSTLQNGVGITISGATNNQQNWTFSVPAGTSTLTVTLNGGTGDADLYVKAGSAPTLSSYDCRPYVNGNTETCTFTSPAAGTWYVMVNGYAAYSGVTLKATWGADTTTALSNNVPVGGISGATGSQQYWKLTVPAGQTQVVFQISGGTGDADLYVKSGSKPTTTSYNCRPYINGNSETCTIANPAAGDWYVMLRGYAAFSGVSLVGHYP
ncbi:MAG: pre-peptidase C-terminal domain-containing protein [Deltaproteobacteria bacterium]|nr:pre-peptidase C-terminal domain-containing protein [Deltaproteobacteria bacterium]